MSNYKIINADVIEKQIEELKKPIAHHDGIYISDEQNVKIDILEELLSNSIPLIPEIEKAFSEGIINDYYSDVQEYISNLKLNI